VREGIGQEKREKKERGKGGVPVRRGRVRSPLRHSKIRSLITHRLAVNYLK